MYNFRTKEGNIMNAKAYSEVAFILESLDDNLKNKIPDKLLALINNKKIKYYTPSIDINKPLCEQNLEHDTLVFLAMLYYNCWCENADEKQEILEILKTNEK